MTNKAMEGEMTALERVTNDLRQANEARRDILLLRQQRKGELDDVERQLKAIDAHGDPAEIARLLGLAAAYERLMPKLDVVLADADDRVMLRRRAFDRVERSIAKARDALSVLIRDRDKYGDPDKVSDHARERVAKARVSVQGQVPQ